MIYSASLILTVLSMAFVRHANKVIWLWRCWRPFFYEPLHWGLDFSATVACSVGGSRLPLGDEVIWRLFMRLTELIIANWIVSTRELKIPGILRWLLQMLTRIVRVLTMLT